MLQVPGGGRCVAEVRGGAGGRKPGAVPHCMQLLTGTGAGTLLVVGDDAGDVCAYDLRMLSAQQPVWSLSASLAASAALQQQAGGRQHHQAYSHNPLGGSCLCMTTWGPEQDPHGLVIPRPHVLPPSPLQSGSGVALSVLGGQPAALRSSAGSSAMLAAAAAGGGGSAQGGSATQLPAHVRLRHLVACGGKDGSVLLIDGATGALVAGMDKVHWQHSRGSARALVGMLLGGGTGGGGSAASLGGGGMAGSAHSHHHAQPHASSGVVGVPVTGLVACEGGMVSCGADGVVRFHALSPVVGARV